MIFGRGNSRGWATTRQYLVAGAARLFPPSCHPAHVSPVLGAVDPAWRSADLTDLFYLATLVMLQSLAADGREAWTWQAHGEKEKKNVSNVVLFDSCT